MGMMNNGRISVGRIQAAQLAELEERTRMYANANPRWTVPLITNIRSSDGYQAWGAGTYYAGVRRTHGGQLYESRTTTSATPGTDDTWRAISEDEVYGEEIYTPESMIALADDETNYIIGGGPGLKITKNEMRFTAASVVTGDTFRLTVNDGGIEGPENIDFVVGATQTASAVYDGLAAAWNASAHALCTPITASRYGSSYLKLVTDYDVIFGVTIEPTVIGSGTLAKSATNYSYFNSIFVTKHPAWVAGIYYSGEFVTKDSVDYRVIQTVSTTSEEPGPTATDWEAVPRDGLQLDSAMCLSMWLYIPEGYLASLKDDASEWLTNCVYIDVYHDLTSGRLLSDDNRTARLSWGYTVLYNSVLNPLVEGWNLVRLPIDAQTDGNEGIFHLNQRDGLTIKALRIGFQTNPNLDFTATIGGVFFECQEKCKLIISSDGARKLFTDVAYPDLRQRKYPWVCNLAIARSYIYKVPTTEPRCTEEELIEYMSENSNECTIHSYDGDPGRMSAEELRSDTIKAQKWLAARGQTGRVYRGAWLYNEATEKLECTDLLLASAASNPYNTLVFDPWPSHSMYNFKRWGPAGLAVGGKMLRVMGFTSPSAADTLYYLLESAYNGHPQWSSGTTTIYRIRYDPGDDADTTYPEGDTGQKWRIVLSTNSGATWVVLAAGSTNSAYYDYCSHGSHDYTAVGVYTGSPRVWDYIEGRWERMKLTRGLVYVYLHGVHADGGNNVTPTEWADFIARVDEAVKDGWLEVVSMTQALADIGYKFRTGPGGGLLCEYPEFDNATGEFVTVHKLLP